MLMKTKAILYSILILAIVAPCTNAFAKPEMILKFAGQHAVDHPATLLMHEIAKEITEKTEGRIEVKIYPANQLGDYTLTYEELIRGTIDLGCLSVPSQFDPRLELCYINGYVASYEDAKKVFATDGWLFSKMSELNNQLGVKLLGFYIEGMIGIGSTKPVIEPLNPDIQKGVLVRIPNMDVYKLAAEAMGYKTVTIPYADVFQAIQTGIVDGVDGFPVAAAYTALGDVIKYWYMTNYSTEVINFMMSQKTWEKIKPADQKAIQEILSRATVQSIEKAKETDEKYMDLLREKGVQVFTYTKEELAPIMKAVASTWPALEKNMTKELIDEFRRELAPE